ncbi:MAG: flagellar hook capping FlgD N-terminal domain-containing protein [Gemmatales bacterium]|nr:flagellar hook capping protein [Gemmatales bacterium]MDW8175274.1 flagellar hook capping FlgD N-terminal domain-containing protein [Gemmatales bacterium]
MTIGQLTGAQGLLDHSSSRRANSLGRDEFLQLLVAQLKHQNPMSPLDGADFAVQLAQFSQLEHLMQLNQNMQQWLQLQQLVQAANLVGRRVHYQTGDGQSTRTGTVMAVHFVNNSLLLQVNGEMISTAQIRALLA